MFARFTVLT